MLNQKLLLASGSPRRRELLSWLDLPFEVCSVDIDESPVNGEEPDRYVLRLSNLKAKKASAANPAYWVLGSDTTVADGQMILGKPGGPEQAEKMLLSLRGRCHQVYTAISVVDMSSNRIESTLCSSKVPMRKYSEEEINAYIASGDPLDKAGAYGIQNRDFHPVENFSGCFANVMGLPVCHLVRLLHSWGVLVEKDVSALCKTHLQYTCSISSRILSGQDLG